MALAFGLHCWAILKCLNLHPLHAYLSCSLFFRVGPMPPIMIFSISILIFFNYSMGPFREFKNYQLYYTFREIKFSLSEVNQQN